MKETQCLSPKYEDLESKLETLQAQVKVAIDALEETESDGTVMKTTRIAVAEALVLIRQENK